ncbi:hypothetical protein OG301_39370 (plasmid) [Streptomyces platensis]|uniref:hypothetical protein n=1 Tax=Streptomyces platensis TaxID=58346 RepID=UPI002ED6B579|nr:hypothetical protein OG301_39370 [Streptomyces platensis]
MTTAAATPITLIPTGDATPVEKAAVDGIVDGFDPETFLWIVFHRPDGSARIWYAWTTGGTSLGDRIDDLALNAGLDVADWLHIGDQHCEHSTRGRIDIQAYALRPIFADVQAGVRGPEDRRDGLRRVIACAAEKTGQTPHPGVPRWLGVGPTLLNRK